MQVSPIVDLAAAQAIAAVVSGVLLGLVGAACLLVRPSRSPRVSFAVFLLVWAGLIVFGNLSRLAGLAGDVPLAERLILFHQGMMVFVSAPLLRFAATYPARPASDGTGPSWIPAVLAFVVVGAVAIVVRPSLFYRGYSAPFVSAWGPLSLVYTTAFSVALYVTMRSLWRHAAAVPGSIGARQANIVLAALAVYVAYSSAENLVLFGWPLVVRGTSATGFQGLLFSGTALVGLGVIGASSRGLRRATTIGRWRAGRVAVLTCVVPALFGLVSGAVWHVPGVVHLETLGLWRVLTAAGVAYGLLRFEVIDLGIRARRVLTAAAALAGTACAALAARWALARIAGPTHADIAVASGLAVMVGLLWSRRSGAPAATQEHAKVHALPARRREG